ncbi:nitric oxide reductase activation protein NorD [Mycobacterium avium]|uniref:Nitric oxide reductase activation protein NorD n=4 Tax=Mycobacterium avium TaxID=1764 RepID=A0A088DHC7_MYCAV|nr:VWA domain-containing protein [Mycobacterium avium]AIL92382.1 nitric oxide reductase activation protein NorD [Mycobacterium avium subsp. hominissuis]MDO2351598.1 VWA domain-containing protein [Mycobacterium avium subsp. hominissuis]
MTASDPNSPQRLRLLATFIAGRSIDVTEAPAGQAAHTNGQVIFVSAGGSAAEQRREMLIQSALLGAGSLDQRFVKPLRSRPVVARRYLALEGHRVLAELARGLPLAAALCPDGQPTTATADDSLEKAGGRVDVADPPEWFGDIRPSRLLSASVGTGGPVTNKELRLEFNPIDVPEADDDGDDEQSGESKILKLFETPLFNSQALSDYFRKLLGSGRSPGDGAAGAEMQVRAVRRAHKGGAHARPLPTRIHFTDDGKPGAALGVGGALYPEWDVHHNRYRPQWCRVIDFPLTAAADVSDAGVPHDDVLRRRLSRIGLGPKVLRARPDGDELDIEALIDLFVDLRSGHSPPDHVYLDRRKLARNLGVLILLDASGSVTDTDLDGLAVHDHQRRTAATLAVTLEELGDRVAVYAFRSQGRHAVHLPAIKTFGQRFGAVGRARLNQLQPSSYTRLGAGIRGAGEILKTEAGTPNRLLVVLSDGFPYDDGYEGRYAEADTRKAIEELRTDGLGCLCLSIGGAPAADALERVFGSAGYASAATLADLSPQMDELFLTSLRELAAPKPMRR